ncbi:MAG: anti-sigma F factor [Oscillospiraceae bacterium]|nr:anti-sigma F factor [Oscillospiraceae bacterium]
MKIHNYLKLEFPSRSVNEAMARNAAALFVLPLDPTLEELGDLKTAVSEAVTNCIVHAYTGEVGVITLKCRILDDNVAEIIIKDRGCGIEDVDKARQPLYTTGGEERAGMGFSIMESFTDEMRVRSRPGRGTTVVLRKRIGGRNEQ